jgi:hypothetical protein
VRAFVARGRHAEQVSALAGLQLTSIVGVQPAQLAAKAVTSSTRSTPAVEQGSGGDSETCTGRGAAVPNTDLELVAQVRDRAAQGSVMG